MRRRIRSIEPIIERVRAEQMVEVRGASGSGTPAFRYALTDVGRSRARQYLDVNQYIGAAPVPLAAYVAYMRGLREARGYIERERLRRGFSHLVISDDVLEQLGPAVNAGKAVFLYGSPGNGKTVIAEGWGVRWAATCTSRTPSPSTGRSSRCSIRSTRPTRSGRRDVEHHRHRARERPMGSHPPPGVMVGGE